MSGAGSQAVCVLGWGDPGLTSHAYPARSEGETGNWIRREAPGSSREARGFWRGVVRELRAGGGVGVPLSLMGLTDLGHSAWFRLVRELVKLLGLLT